MDIYRFFNSKDMADHLREIGYEFNAFEAAYIVDRCDSATLDEKIEAWQTNIDTMPDCPTGWRLCTEKHESTHEFLREYIDLQRRMLVMFEQGEGCVYLVEKARYRHWPENYEVRNRRGNWVEWGHIAFSSLTKCVEHLRSEKEDNGDDFDRYVISRIVVDSGEGNYGRGSGELVIDGSFCPLSVDICGLGESDSGIAHELSHSFVELPVPFMRGDIVVDRTDPEPHPFVFDHLKFWDSAEYVEHGGEALPPEKAGKIDQRVAKMDSKHGWDISHMAACGYELGSHYDGGPLDDPCDICSDVFGAGDNYLDLERYDGPLEGELKILEAASRFMKGEIVVEIFLNSTYLTSLASQAKRLERSYDSEYVPEVRHLYQGGEL